MDKKNAVLFAGESNLPLAQEIARYAEIPMGKLEVARFPDGEITIEVKESVRGKVVFVVQSTALEPNEYLMELLILTDALRRASAKGIVAVIPYFGYARQDRKDRPRVPITAKLVANLLAEAGITRVITMDLHAEQVQGFFDIPVDHLYARPLLVEAIKAMGFKGIVVAPDIGSVKIVRSFAKNLKCDFAVIDKHRHSASHVEVLNIVGDINGKDVLLADDMCSTGGTLLSAAKACREKGAKRIFAAVTHGLFVGNAIDELAKSPIDKIFITDTIAHEGLPPKWSIVPTGELFGKALHSVLSNQSITSLFVN